MSDINEEFSKLIDPIVSSFETLTPTGEAYFEWLNHLPHDALRAAVTRAIYELEQAERPSIATLHRFAQEWLHGVELEANEAWGLIQRAVEHWDRRDVKRATQAREMLPDHLLAMVQAMGGFPAIADAQNAIEAQSLFCSNYERLRQRVTRFGRLPAGVAPRVRHSEYYERRGLDERREKLRKLLADWSVANG